MAFISEYVEVDEVEKQVRFFGQEKWVEVDDVDAWVAAFWDKARSIAFEVGNVCSSIIEKQAFDAVT